jgi:hypothetical protein
MKTSWRFRFSNQYPFGFGCPRSQIHRTPRTERQNLLHANQLFFRASDKPPTPPLRFGWKHTPYFFAMTHRCRHARSSSVAGLSRSTSLVRCANQGGWSALVVPPRSPPHDGLASKQTQYSNALQIRCFYLQRVAARSETVDVHESRAQRGNETEGTAVANAPERHAAARRFSLEGEEQSAGRRCCSPSLCDRGTHRAIGRRARVP